VLLAVVLAGCGATQTLSATHTSTSSSAATSRPPTVTVPHLIGLSEAVALARLGKLALTPSPITQITAKNPAADRHVLSQVPQAGTSVRAGAAITIRVEHYVPSGAPTGLGGIGH
jgi:beta-lactam-binding protein with PASTA domain